MTEVLLVVLGLGSALISGYFAGRRASKQAREKETRLAVAGVAKGIAVAVHSMAWLTWKATFQPAHLRVEHADTYDNDMHALYPDLVGALSQVAALDGTVYRSLRPIVDEVYSLDHEVALAATPLRDESGSAAQEMAALREQVRSLEKATKDRLANIASNGG
jgi:hypothetical protein